MPTYMTTFKTIYFCMVTFALLVISTHPVAAQDRSTITNTTIVSNSNPNSNQTTQNDPSTQNPCLTINTPPAKVTDAYKEVPTNETALPEIKQVQLGDVLIVKVENLGTLMNEAKCAKKQIVLFLDERPLKNITPYPPTATNGPMLRFTLTRSEDDRDVWTHLLGKPSWKPHDVNVSIGLADQAAIPSDDVKIKFVAIPQRWFAFWAILFAVILISFLCLAIRSSVLRDAVAPSDDAVSPPTTRPLASYSLARTQCAWWFFLVFSSYLFIGIITGDFATSITGTVLGLIGISAGTVVSAAVIDKNNATKEPASNAVSEQMTKLSAQMTDLSQKIKDQKEPQQPNTQVPKSNDESGGKELQAQEQKSTDQKTVVTKPTEPQKEKEATVAQSKELSYQHKTFLHDILSDSNGIAFHRFQIAAWTLVLGIIFISAVYKELAMPNFDGSLLALLGISGGTYLGFKIGETE